MASVSSIWQHAREQCRRPLPLLFTFSVILNVLLWLAALVMFPRALPAAVLHYSIDIGIDFIGEGKQIIVLPATGTASLVGNGLLGWLLSRTDPEVAWVVWSIIPAAQVILAAAFFLIWRANW